MSHKNYRDQDVNSGKGVCRQEGNFGGKGNKVLQFSQRQKTAALSWAGKMFSNRKLSIVHLSIHPCIHLSTYPSIHASIHPSNTHMHVLRLNGMEL